MPPNSLNMPWEPRPSVGRHKGDSIYSITTVTLIEQSSDTKQTSAINLIKIQAIKGTGTRDE